MTLKKLWAASGIARRRILIAVLFGC
jgi:hypothetical protein